MVYKSFRTNAFELVHRGKVRDSYKITSDKRLIAVTDRISAFDFILDTLIPGKGAILNGLSNYWFGRTEHIIHNHVVEQIDPQLTIVNEAEPIRLEMVVRGFMAGSMWRYYEQGKRVFSGITVQDNLRKHDQFEVPLLTPTTKAESDVEISEQEILASGIVTERIYSEMKEKALALYITAAEELRSKGIVLVDTKYEFGIRDGSLLLIDEIHTPDSSRYWQLEDYHVNPLEATQIDKEYLRQWLLANKVAGEFVSVLPAEVISEVSKRYSEIFSLITNRTPIPETGDVLLRVKNNLINAGLLTTLNSFEVL